MIAVVINVVKIIDCAVRVPSTTCGIALVFLLCSTCTRDGQCKMIVEYNTQDAQRSTSRRTVFVRSRSVPSHTPVQDIQRCSAIYRPIVVFDSADGVVSFMFAMNICLLHVKHHSTRWQYCIFETLFRCSKAASSWNCGSDPEHQLSTATICASFGLLTGLS